MKKIVLFLIIFIVISCNLQDVREQNLTRPKFEYQKTYVLQQAPGEFFIYFNVWKSLPVDFLDFENIKQMNEAKAFTARQKIQLIGNEYLIIDRITNKKYTLKQHFNKSLDDLVSFTISDENSIIGIIDQIDIYDIWYYEYTQGDKKYTIKGEIKKIGTDIQSIIFTIKHNDDELGTIFKEFSYFKNNYEIFINRKFNNIEDPIFISFGVFIDQILRENGYKFK